MLDKVFGRYICADCNKRFKYFGYRSADAIARCPYCGSGNWYEHKNYKQLIKLGVTIKKESKK